MDPLEKAIAANVLLGTGMQAVDAYGDITVQHFVDLLSAVHDENLLEVLSEALSQFISSSAINLSDYQAVVSPKLGNVLLGKRVANKLNKPSGFVRHSILFGKFIETTELSGTKLLLVDDVSSEDKILTDCVRNAGAEGSMIDIAVTVLDRKEGNAAVRLEKRGVQLLALRRYDDRELGELVREFKRGL
jgi:orotate phosphoribosyltransferase